MDFNPLAPAATLPGPDALERKVTNGTSWFFWIAGLSLVNSAMVFAGSDTSFLVGLAVTQLVDAIAHGTMADGGPAALAYVALGIDLVVFGGLLALGKYSRTSARLYVAGIVLYALDAVLCAAFDLWEHVAFHALALFFLWTGLGALRHLRAANAPPTAEPRPNPLVR